jgi:hypothetical protein
MRLLSQPVTLSISIFKKERRKKEERKSGRLQPPAAAFALSGTERIEPLPPRARDYSSADIMK